MDGLGAGQRQNRKPQVGSMGAGQMGSADHEGNQVAGSKDGADLLKLRRRAKLAVKAGPLSDLKMKPLWKSGRRPVL